MYRNSVVVSHQGRIDVKFLESEEPLSFDEALELVKKVWYLDDDTVIEHINSYKVE
jgi:hypothetical protein